GHETVGDTMRWTILLLGGLIACGDKPEDTTGDTDDGSTDTLEDPDADGDGVEGALDCDDDDASVFPGATESCDGLDNDCDGTIDEGYDNDGDGTTSCDGDCNDEDASIRPGVSESCDGIDNNCDGAIDEGLGEPYYQDIDSDGYGNDDTLAEYCDPPSGYVSVGGDCDDASGAVYPGAADVCDGLDNDCDTSIDEDASFSTALLDSDGDGFGNNDKTIEYCDALPSGYTTTGDDCDDSEASVNPDEREACDGLDNDCDGAVDGSDALGAQDYYADADGDGFGDAASSTRDCTQPTGSVTNRADCDDTDSSINPSATEVCDDGLDNDCDSRVDEDLLDYYPDDDGDGHGDENEAATTTCTPPSGYVDANDDCDDTDATINPRASEVCDDEIDNDCSGETDEYCYDTWTGSETFDYSTGGVSGARNCELYWETTGTPTTFSGCPTCEFAFEVDYAYDSTVSSDDGACTTQTWTDGNSIADDHTFTYGFLSDYNGRGEALGLDYYGSFYFWFYGVLDLTTDTLTYSYGYEDYAYGSLYYTYYQYGSVALE
ncbi:MAG: hypothetical protein ACI8RZ_005302, partial [Myxococcota bacterium]